MSRFRTLSQVFNDYWLEARGMRIKEYGHDPLESPATPSLDADALLTEAMTALAAAPRCLFIGQGVRCGGVATSKHLEGVPLDQRIEFPVAEELQLGASLGLSLAGYLVVSVFPRMDFLLRAADQLVNHLDKLEAMSCGQFHPKVIVRTRVGQRLPLDAGPQHTQNHVKALREMLTSVLVEEITQPQGILLAYRDALLRDGSTVVVENLMPLVIPGGGPCC